MAYTLGDLTTELQTKSKDSSLAPSLIAYFLNEAQSNILGNSSFSFMETSGDSTLSVGQATVAYPADHQSSIDLVLIDPVTPTTTRRLKYIPAETFFRMNQNPSANPQALPTTWTDFGHQIYFNTPVDQAYTLRHRYIRIPIVLTNPSDVPDVPASFRHVMITYAMSYIELYRDNHAFASTYAAHGDQYMEDMVIRLSQRQEGDSNLMTNTMGGGLL